MIVWLDANEIRHTPEPKFTGTSGYDHLFNFVIPKSRKEPESIVQAINRPTRETALAFINACTDTRQTRASESRAYALLNDIEQPVSNNVIDAFQNYEITGCAVERPGSSSS